MREPVSPRALTRGSLAALPACEATKSANPLSPTVAGPIPGVNITPPKPLEPGNGWQLKADKQPVTLLLENASSNGVRPLSYVFEVATDAAFGSKVFTKTGIAPGQAGRTSLKLQRCASDRTHLLLARPGRGRRQHGAVLERPSASCCCSGYQSTAGAPVSGQRRDGRSSIPNCGSRTRRAQGRSGPSATAWRSPATTPSPPSSGRGGVGERGGRDQREHGRLPASTTLFWRVRASDPANQGPWSPTAYFVHRR